MNGVCCLSDEVRAGLNRCALCRPANDQEQDDEGGKEEGEVGVHMINDNREQETISIGRAAIGEMDKLRPTNEDMQMRQ